ncbi:MAG: copper resistance protein NlpE N-terminal domain-containing protein, partial [Chitinophagaceae bacterium]|nr:copper resistance protein NlpE N-terminal domain-containing protein [Chitinophagaceae bacterium]
MIPILKAVVFLLMINAGLTGNYHRHIQICTGVFALDREWQLDLRTDGTFTYHIKTTNTKSIKRKTIVTYSGTWQSNNDTLTLLENKKEKELYFRREKDRFIPLNEKPDTLNNFVIFLDYLENAELKN